MADEKDFDGAGGDDGGDDGARRAGGASAPAVVAVIVSVSCGRPSAFEAARNGCRCCRATARVPLLFFTQIAF